MKHIFHTIFILLFLFNTQNANSQDVVTLKSLSKSVFQNHPVILQEFENIKMYQSKIQESEGQFDAQLTSKISERTMGYYDGDYSEALLEKPLKVMNSDIFLKYSSSINNFPVYEQEYMTPDQGELSLGLRFSLLRYREIDNKRMKLKNSEVDFKIAETKLLQIKEMLNFYIYQSFWTWILNAHEVQVYKDLLLFSENQDKAIRQRVKKGDLPQIYIIENAQYILKRKNQVENAKQKLKQSELIISLLWRDSEGKPKKIIVPKIDSNELLFVESVKINKDIIEKSILSSPQMNIYNKKLQILKNELLNAQNYLKPKLDLELITSNGGRENLENNDEVENKVMLKFEVPIERNLGNAKISKLKAKQNKILFQRKFYKDKLKANFENLQFQLESIKMIMNNYRQEISYAERMQDAERIKFKNGGSDFFLLNIREQNTASSKINLLKSKKKYVKLYVKYALAKSGILKTLKI